MVKTAYNFYVAIFLSTQKMRQYCHIKHHRQLLPIAAVLFLMHQTSFQVLSTLFLRPYSAFHLD